MGRGVVPELGDQWVPLEGGLHDPALDAAAAAVNQAQLTQSGLMRRVNVFLHDGGDVARRKRMEVELGLDRNAMWQVIHVAVPRFGRYWRYSATTVVVIPPRAVNAPVTVMRRGRQAATRSSRIRLVADS